MRKWSTACGGNLHKFGLHGQVGQESNLHPAVLETPSGVSWGVGRHRHMPLCPTRSVAACRRLSPCVGGHWGRYWGSRRHLVHGSFVRHAKLLVNYEQKTSSAVALPRTPLWRRPCRHTWELTYALPSRKCQGVGGHHDRSPPTRTAIQRCGVAATSLPAAVPVGTLPKLSDAPS